MNGLPYYKRYPRDLFEGTLGMSFELKAAYSLVLDLIYMQSGQLPDDARYIAGLLNVSVRRWNSMRSELIEKGKIQVIGEFLTNYRAVSELESLSKFQDKQRENASGPRKNNNLEKPRLYQSESESEPDTYIDDADESGMTFRERILKEIGADPVSGITGHGGRMLGVRTDMIEAEKWVSELRLSEQSCLTVIREVMSKRKSGPPSTFRYFTPAMRELAAAIQSEKITPMPLGERHDRSPRKPSNDDILHAAQQIAARIK